MPAHCPKCASQLLVAVEGLSARSGAVASQCPSCKGLWVPPEIVALPDSAAHLSERDAKPSVPSTETQRTGQCPEAHGLLRRARVTLHDPYYLERCARCGGVWFDAGEWTRAVAGELLGNLSEVWSPTWRKHLSEQQFHESLEVDLRAKLGGELLGLLHTLATRLEAHPHRGVALAYLSERLKHPDEFSEDP